LKNGVLSRSFEVDINRRNVAVKTSRFLSIDDRDLAVIQYSITALNRDMEISVTPYLSADVYNYTDGFQLTTKKHKNVQ